MCGIVAYVGTKIISIVTEGDESIKRISDHCIEIPESDELFTPLFASDTPSAFILLYRHS